jgi:hypothetical protein
MNLSALTATICAGVLLSLTAVAQPAPAPPAKACVPKADCCKVCDKGEPCGDTCIPAGKQCTVKAKDCKDGQACGGTCIPKDKKCHDRQHCACKKSDVCAK